MASDTIGTLALVQAPGTPFTSRALLGTVGANVAWFALAHSTLRITLGSGLSLALALVTTVGAPGESWTGHVALGAKASRVTLAEAKHSVASHIRAHHGAPTLTLATIVSGWTSVLTQVTRHSRGTRAVARYGVTRASILTPTHLITARTIKPSGTGERAGGAGGTWGTHTA